MAQPTYIFHKVIILLQPGLPKPFPFYNCFPCRPGNNYHCYKAEEVHEQYILQYVSVVPLISGAFITNCTIKCAIKTGTNKIVKNHIMGHDHLEKPFINVTVPLISL